MNTLTITFNNQQFDIRTNTEGLYSLTDIEQAWKQSGGEGKSLAHWKRSPEVKELMELLCEFRIVAISGGKDTPDRGTWASKEALIEYAGHCSTSFKMTTLRALKQLSEGNYLEASDSVLTVIQTQELKSKYKALQDSLYEVFEVWNKTQSHERGFDIILKNLIQFNTCGITSKKIQRESGRNLVDNLLSTGNTEGITAMIQSMVMVTNAMRADLGYYQIKLMVASHLFTENDVGKMKTDLSNRKESRTGSYKTSDEEALKDDF